MPTDSKSNSIEDTINKSDIPILNSLSMIYGLISLLYLVNGVMWSMNLYSIYNEYNVLTEGLGFLFFRDFPIIGLIPITLFTISFLSLIGAFRIRTLSRNDYYFGFGFLLLIIIVPFDIRMIMSGFIASLGISYGVSANGSITDVISNVSSIISILGLCILLYSNRNFYLLSKLLEKKKQILLVAIGIIFLLPIYLYTGYLYLELKLTDFGFSKAQASVSYKLYKGVTSPNNTKEIRMYLKNEEQSLGIDNNISSFYIDKYTTVGEDNNSISSSPLKLSSFVSFVQAGVNSNFDLKKEIEKYYHLSENDIAEVKLNKGKDGLGYETKDKNLNLIRIFFITSDNTLIILSGYQYKLNDLVNFANSLN